MIDAGAAGAGGAWKADEDASASRNGDDRIGAGALLG
jgi:hypothetical protein